jgi:hypothetical protein
MAACHDITGAEPFLNGLLDRTSRVSATHPGPHRGLALLRTAIAEAKQAHGAGMLP